MEPALKQYNEILSDAKQLIDNDSHKKKLVTNFNSSIDFEDVNFSYHKNEPILENVNFKIKKNDFVILREGVRRRKIYIN